ncbi:bacterial transcriptional activator domain-containing protein [Streptomyces virginiae]|uniref:bacterial transcriptional activator domain-containing protein n=1 Tax=Streptomyces virginiae TaxID=1961 RepID=UPI003679161E
MSPLIRIDVQCIRDTARHILDGRAPSPADSEQLVEELTRELLPGWPDEWLRLDREHWDQIRLYALEGLAVRLLTARQYLPALQAALAATAIDPIRETPRRIVIEIYLAEGNVASAVRCYQHYETYLQHQLKVSPSAQMTDLLQGLPCLRLGYRKQHTVPAKASIPARGGLSSHLRNTTETLSARSNQRWHDGKG